MNEHIIFSEAAEQSTSWKHKTSESTNISFKPAEINILKKDWYMISLLEVSEI